jgi:PhnB protein
MSDSAITTTLPKTSPGLGVVTPYLSVRGAAAALAFYAEVFGAVEEAERYIDESDGRVGHAQFRIGDSSLQIADEYPDFQAVGPETLGGTTVGLSIYVHDVDSVYEKAVAAGARGVRPPSDQFYGRAGTILDPWGHRWTIQMVVDDRALPEVEGFDVVPAATASAEAVPERSARALGLLHGPAQLGYFAMSTTDVETSSSFFSALFGWQVEPGGHIANIDPPGGIIPSESLSVPTLYFQIPDMDVAVAKVVELGGTVLSRTMYESGDNAECTDTNGTRFDLYVPKPGYERQ